MVRLRIGASRPRTDEAAFDTHGAIVIKDNESAAARDIVGIVGGPPCLQPLDFGLKLAEPGVYVVGKFIGRLMLFGQVVEFRVGGGKARLIFRRQHHRVWVRPAHAVGVRKSRWASVHFQPSDARSASASRPSFAVTSRSSNATSSK